MSCRYIFCRVKPIVRNFSAHSRLKLSSNVNGFIRKNLLFGSKGIPSFYLNYHELQCTRAFAASNHGRQYDPYEVLGIDSSATDKEIKLAYFREAKKCHPDVNPNDPAARHKFQRCATAYDLIKNRSSKPISGVKINEDGTVSGPTYGGAGSGAYGGSSYTHASATDMFTKIMQDEAVIREALGLWTDDIKFQMSEAYEAAGRGDWSVVSRVANDNKGLIFGIMLPTFILVRYPALAIAMTRYAMAGFQVILVAMVRGGVTINPGFIWQHLVNIALRERQRLLIKKKEAEAHKNNSGSGSSSDPYSKWRTNKSKKGR